MAEPFVVTPNSLFQRIPASLLGLDLSDPGAAMISQLITSWLKQNIVEPVTGISPSDPLWGATLYTNMTGFGTMMQGLNAAANSRGLQNMMQMQAAARFQFLESWQRTATTPEMFAAMSPEARGGFSDYEAFIEHKTQGMMDNQILSMLMQSGIWDPTGKMMASAYIKEASSNIAREGLWRGQKDYMEKADAVSQIFMNPDTLKLDYRKSDYGSMSLNESAAVLAALTKGMDFAPGAKDETDIANAVNALRDRLKGLTTAMSPLKDFFGDDIPQMIEFLEELSGKAFTELDNGTVNDLTRRITNSMTTGVYTADQIRNVSKFLGQSLGQMDSPYYIDTEATALAHTMLATTNAGATPALMTDASFSRLIADRTIRHAASPFANAINLAYSVWKGNRDDFNRAQTDEKNKMDTSFQTFRMEYESLTRGENAITAEEAMMRMTNTSSIQQMTNIGYSRSGYVEAVTKGWGAAMTDTESARRRALQASLSQVGQDRVAWMNVFDLFTSEDARNGRDLKTVEAQIKSWESSANEEERAMFRAFSTMTSNPIYKELMADMYIVGANLDTDRKNQKAEQVRAHADFIKGIFGRDAENAANVTEFIVNALLGKGDESGNIDAFKNIERTKEAVSAMLISGAGLTSADYDNITTILQVGSLAAKDLDSGRRAQAYEKMASVAENYMLDTIKDPDRAAALAPYIQAVREILPENWEALDEKGRAAFLAENQDIIDSMQFAVSLSSEALDLFAKEDAAANQSGGTALRAFVQRTRARYNELNDVRQQWNAFQNSGMSLDDRLDLIRGYVTQYKASGSAGGFAPMFQMLNDLVPDWEDTWNNALAEDKKNGDKKATNAVLENFMTLTTAFLGKDVNQFLQRDLKTYSAWQVSQFGPNKEAIAKKIADATAATIQDIGTGTLFNIGNGTPKTAEQWVNEAVAELPDVLQNPDKYNEWFDRYFGNDKLIGQEARTNINGRFSGILRTVQDSGIQTIESEGSMSATTMLAKAFGDGKMFEELNRGIKELTNILGNLPTLLEDAVKPWWRRQR